MQFLHPFLVLQQAMTLLCAGHGRSIADIHDTSFYKAHELVKDLTHQSFAASVD